MKHKCKSGECRNFCNEIRDGKKAAQYAITKRNAAIRDMPTMLHMTDTILTHEIFHMLMHMESAHSEYRQIQRQQESPYE